MCAVFVFLLMNLSNAQTIANFEDKILGITFQYPPDWGPAKLTQKGALNEVTISVKEYTTMPTLLMEHRYTGDVLVNVENFFPLQMNLAQYFENAFSKARFLPDFKITELDKMTTFAGLPAYKLNYTYTKKNMGDTIKMTSTNIFTIKNNKAYLISFEAPITLYHFYQPNLKKIIDSFRITN